LGFSLAIFGVKTKERCLIPLFADNPSHNEEMNPNISSNENIIRADMVGVESINPKQVANEKIAQLGCI